MNTIHDLARDAIFVQDACNLTGIVHGFSRAMTALRQLEPDHGTDWYNRHPLAVLFTSKLATLTGVEPIGGSLEVYSDAYAWALEHTNDERRGRTAAHRETYP